MRFTQEPEYGWICCEEEDFIGDLGFDLKQM